MERVYLLLRNNQQSGPFTIGELLQQQLRPTDMIWIEGKSAAWTYLSELELSPFAKKPEVFEPQKPIKTEDEIERKAEELRQKILNTAPKTYFPKYVTEIETYASPYKLPEDEIRFVDHRKERASRKSTAIAELLLTCFVIGLFVIGIYKGKSFLGIKDRVHNSVATQLTSGDQHAAHKSAPVVNRIVIPIIDTTRQHDSLLALQKAKPKPIISHRIIDSIVNPLQSLRSATANQMDKKDTQSKSALAVSDENAKEDLPVKKEITSSVVPDIKANIEPKEEKKGFLRSLFRKKKKDEDSNKNEGNE
jgi:hypothetical protein